MPSRPFNRSRFGMFLVAIVAVTAVGCSAEAETTPEPSPVPVEPQPAPVAPEPPPVSLPAPGGDPAEGSESREFVIASTDVAARFGLDVQEVRFDSFEQVTWPNGALGCPEEGLAYTQALVDGYRLTVSAEDATYAYHGAIGSDPFYCADPAA